MEPKCLSRESTAKAEAATESTGMPLGHLLVASAVALAHEQPPPPAEELFQAPDTKVFGLQEPFGDHVPGVRSSKQLLGNKSLRSLSARALDS